MTWVPAIGSWQPARPVRCTRSRARPFRSSTPAAALAPPAAFLGLHLVEGQLVTPHLVGHRLALDPVMVFLAMLMLGWMWGVAGLLLAVPLLTCAKIIAERVDGGETFVTLLSK